MLVNHGAVVLKARSSWPWLPRASIPQSFMLQMTHPSVKRRRKLHVCSEFFCTAVAQLLSTVCHVPKLVTGATNAIPFCGHAIEHNFAISVDLTQLAEQKTAQVHHVLLLTFCQLQSHLQIGAGMPGTDSNLQHASIWSRDTC